MKRLKIRIKSPEHSEKVQRKLFEMGYEWIIDRKTVSYVDSPYLLAGTYGENKITYAWVYGDDGWFNSLPHTEVELVESYEFKEVKKRNVVKIGKKSYYEDELAEALKNIKPLSTDYSYDN